MPRTISCARRKRRIPTTMRAARRASGGSSTKEATSPAWVPTTRPDEHPGTASREDLQMPVWTTPDAVALYARSQPDRIACVDLASARRWTYAALDADIQRAVAVLENSYGVQQGQRIANVARNSADLLILQQAAMR